MSEAASIPPQRPPGFLELVVCAIICSAALFLLLTSFLRCLS